MPPALMLCLTALLAAEPPQPTFYVSYDRWSTADRAGGAGTTVGAANDALVYEAELRTLESGEDSRLEAGKVGRARRFDGSGATYLRQGNLDPVRGTAAMWVQPSWDGARQDLYCSFLGCRNWGLVYKYTNQTYLTFGWIQADGLYTYNCTADIASWRAGQWHHLAVTWDAEAGERAIFLDGKEARRAAIPSRHEPDAEFTVGASYGSINPARALLDEVAVYHRPLTADEIATVYRAGVDGHPLAPAAAGGGGPARPQPPGGDRAALPGFVDWSLPPGPPKASWTYPNQRGGRIGTATRERVSLNGLWRWRPEGTETWRYLRVPGTWRSEHAVRGDDGQRLTETDGRRVSDVLTAWYERDFDLPQGWQDQRCYLCLESVRGAGEVFLNGTWLGRALEFQRATFDVGKRVEPGTNRLQVRVQSLSAESSERGLDQDVWLERRPDGPRLDRLRLEPWPTEGRLRVHASLLDADPRVDVVVEVTDLDGKVVATGGARAAAAVDFDINTPDLAAWWPDSPTLYLAHASLRRGEQVVDQLSPVRFGFRRLTIDGGDFKLNGRRFHFRGQASPPFGNLSFCAVEPAIREWMTEMRRLGVNAVREYTGNWGTGSRCEWRDLYYDIADELGLVVFAHVPSNSAFLLDFDRPPLPELYKARVADFVDRYANHACLAMWFLNFNHGAHESDIRPDLLDGTFDPRVLPEKQAQHRWMDFSERTLRDICDDRPVFHHAAGNYGQVITTMTYLGFGIPLQEREEWPLAWSRRRPKPLMPVETGFPCLLSNYRERVGSLEAVYGSDQLTPEYYAAYVGDRAYANLTADEVRLMNAGTGSNGERMAAMKASVNYDEQKALFARRTLRSWRTFGISYCQHVEWRDCWTYQPEEVALPKLDDRDFGPRLERDTVTFQKAVELNRMGEVCAVDNAPLSAYLAGPEDDFTSKDHAYYAGEEIRKSAVLINDTPEAVRFTGDVVLRVVEHKGDPMPFERVVPPGGIAFVPISLEAPPPRAENGLRLRTPCDLQLNVRAGDGQLPEDRFDLEVFGQAPRPAVDAPLALIDPSGVTRRALARLGVTESAAPDLTAGLLVIGREAFTDSLRDELARGRLRERVEQGLNVLLLEQTGDRLGNLPMDDPNCRHAFVRDFMHPVLRGLVAPDLADWWGQSDLTRPFCPQYSRDDLRWPEEFVRWGNQGVVCSFAPFKPQRGRFRVLVEADYDLILAPLVEWTIGQGHLITCQLDITSRCGEDPVPTLLMARLLEYLAVPHPTPPRTARLVGGTETVRLAEQLELDLAEPANVVLVGPDAALAEPALDALHTAATAGAEVVLVGAANTAAAAGLLEMTSEPQPVHQVTVYGSMVGLGLAPGDFYWRQVRTVPTLSDPGQDPDLRWTRPGVVACRSFGQGRLIWLGVAPGDFADVRAKAKVVRLLALLTAGASTAGFDPLAKEASFGAPGSPYAMPPMDFNPYHYRRW